MSSLSSGTNRGLKVIMVGAPKVGKTALLQRYNDLEFDPLYTPTIAGDFTVKTIEIDAIDVKCQIWDLGGSGILGKSFLRGTNGVILVVDVSSKSSMKVLSNVYDRVKMLVGFVDDSFPCVLVANKVDIAENIHAREITMADLQLWTQSRRPSGDDPITIFEVSAKDGRNVISMFDMILKLAYNKPGNINNSSTPMKGNPSSGSSVALAPVVEEKSYSNNQFSLNDVNSNSSFMNESNNDLGHNYGINENVVEDDQAIAKVVLAGAVSVGKTFILTRFVGDDKDNVEGHYEPTVGADLRIVDMPVKDRTLTLQIWDTSGNPKMITIGRSIYKDADCLIMVFDITSKESFLSLETYWDCYLAYAQPYEPDEFPVLLVGNKSDLNERRAVSMEEILAWCAKKRPRRPITYMGKWV